MRVHHHWGIDTIDTVGVKEYITVKKSSLRFAPQHLAVNKAQVRCLPFSKPVHLLINTHIVQESMFELKQIYEIKVWI